MGSAPIRYWVRFCEVTFERDAAGTLLEVDD